MYFPIQQWNSDAEEAHETVSHIFFSRRVSSRRPEHSLGYAESAQVLTSQRLLREVCNSRYGLSQLIRGSKIFPGPVEKFHSNGGQRFF